eukprot:TRINITY_DN36709_c0_g1_i1.p2 TRINITY_DN36709_c0_g1~~TRINITY_DN36709_c0_g1_i1.p2  ORF type:complete len:114 (+),score=22.47 TRINITY_DN36709_c0_g1_i1:100-441(+)
MADTERGITAEYDPLKQQEVMTLALDRWFEAHSAEHLNCRVDDAAKTVSFEAIHATQEPGSDLWLIELVGKIELAEGVPAVRFRGSFSMKVGDLSSEGSCVVKMKSLNREKGN